MIKKSSSTESKSLNIWVILLATLCGIAWGSYTVDRALLPKFLFFSVLSLFLALNTHKPLSGTETRPESVKKAFFVLLSFYVIWTLLSLFFNKGFEDAWFESAKIVLVFTVAFSLNRAVKNENDLHQIVSKTLGLICAVFVCVISFEYIFLLGKGNISHSKLYTITGLSGHKNLWAEFLLLSLPFVFFIAKNSSSKLWKTGAFLFSLSSVLLIVFSFTRAVWLATAAAATAALTCHLYYRRKLKLKRKLLLTSLLMIPLIVWMGARFLPGEIFKKQIITMVNWRYGTASERLNLWSKSLSLASEKPLTGQGPGQWKVNVLKYGHKGLAGEDNVTFHQRPHNDFIWILCEQGIPALITYVSFMLLALVLFWKKTGEEEDQNKSDFYLACFTALIAYQFISFFSFPKERIEHQLFLALLFAPLIPSNYKSQNQYFQKGPNIALIFTSLVIFLFGILRTNGEIHLKKAYLARSNANWNEVINEIYSAESFVFNTDPMCTPLRWYSGSAWYNLGNQEKAFKDFKSASAISPYHIHVLNNLGTSWALNGHSDSAIICYQKAIEISPGFKDAHLNLAAVLFNTNQKQEAFKQIFLLKADTSDKKHKLFIQTLTADEILRIRDSVPCNDLKMKVEAIYNTPHWAIDLFVKSQKEHSGFTRQILKDAVYVMDSSEKRINFACIQSIRKKYKFN